MTESVVEIKGSQYRYAYDPETQTTRYLGPVGDAPTISEEEFLEELFKLPTKEETFEKAEKWIGNVNEELDESAQVELDRKNGLAIIKLREEGERLPTKLHSGGSLSTVNYA